MISSVFKLKHNLYLEETHYILCINHVTLIIHKLFLIWSQLTWMSDNVDQ